MFNMDWLTDDLYKGWLKKVNGDKHAAYCKVCCKQFSIASMGKAALKSHMDGVNHKKNAFDSFLPRLLYSVFLFHLEKAVSQTRQTVK